MRKFYIPRFDLRLIRNERNLILFMICSLTTIFSASSNPFHRVYPLNGFKLVVDTCMRSYTDALILQDRIANHEKFDEILDLLVGRLIRLQSYVEQLIYAYNYEATVSFDELEYLVRMLEYLELTLSDQAYQEIACVLNHLANHLKQELKDALGIIACSYLMPMQVPLYQSPPLVIPSHRFA